MVGAWWWFMLAEKGGEGSGMWNVKQTCERDHAPVFERTATIAIIPQQGVEDYLSPEDDVEVALHIVLAACVLDSGPALRGSVH